MAAVASAMPAWQTGELDEEWVEASPSPPQTLSELPDAPAESIIPADPTSIKAKRGSLAMSWRQSPCDRRNSGNARRQGLRFEKASRNILLMCEVRNIIPKFKKLPAFGT